MLSIRNIRYIIAIIIIIHLSHCKKIFQKSCHEIFLVISLTRLLKFFHASYIKILPYQILCNEYKERVIYEKLSLNIPFEYSPRIFRHIVGILSP